MDDVAVQYLDLIGKLLPFRNEQTNQQLKEIEDSIQEFLEENPDATILNIQKRFGLPQDIANDIMNTVDVRDVIAEKDAALKTKSHNRRRIIIVSLAIGVFFFFAVLVFYFSAYFTFTFHATPYQNNISDPSFVFYTHNYFLGEQIR